MQIVLKNIFINDDKRGKNKKKMIKKDVFQP